MNNMEEPKCPMKEMSEMSVGVVGDDDSGGIGVTMRVSRARTIRSTLPNTNTNTTTRCSNFIY